MSVRRPRTALLVSAGATAAFLLLDSASPSFESARVLALAVALSAFALAMFREARQPGLDRRTVLAVSGLVLLVAVAVPPRGSQDLWSYATYGRIVAHYDQNPYQRTPDDFPGDPIARRVAPGWRTAPSVYGPAFVGLAALGSKLAGASPVANRLFFQVFAAASILAMLAGLARRGAEPGALAFLGLNPVVPALVVNGGHNDALLGALALGGILLVAARSPAKGGLLLGLAALVKIVAVLPLAAVAVWLWRSGRRRAAVTAAASGTLAVIAGYGLAGGRAALRPVFANRQFHSRASVWSAVRWLGPLLRSPATITLVVGLVLVLVLAGRSPGPLPLAAGAAVAAYFLAAPYVLPWYAMWALPLLALAWRTPLAAVVAAYAGLLGLVYLNPPALDPDFLHTALTGATVVLLPVIAIATLVYLVHTSWRVAPDLV